MAQWVSRTWAFTYNNQDLDALKAYGERIKAHGTQLVFQYECGQTGNLHIQGVIDMGVKVKMSEMRRILPGAHIEKCKDFFASVKYCTKADTRIDVGIHRITETLGIPHKITLSDVEFADDFWNVPYPVKCLEGHLGCVGHVKKINNEPMKWPPLPYDILDADDFEDV